VKLSISRQSLDREDILPLHIFDRISARPHSLFVNDHRTRAALAVAAAELCTGKAKIRAQNPKKRPVSIRRKVYGPVVEFEANPLFHDSSPSSTKNDNGKIATD